MSISSIGSTAVQGYQPARPKHEPPPMTNTAELLGMTTDDLRQARQSGTTLTDLATQQGVSSDDLIKSITADLKANKPEGAPELSDTQLAEMASNIASGKRPQGAPQGPPPGDRAQSNRQDFMQMLSLGMPIDASLVGGVNVDRYA